MPVIEGAEGYVQRSRPPPAFPLPSVRAHPQCGAQSVNSTLALLRASPRFASLFSMLPCDLWSVIKGRTLWLAGDSQSQRMYRTIRCFLRDFLEPGPQKAVWDVVLARDTRVRRVSLSVGLPALRFALCCAPSASLAVLRSVRGASDRPLRAPSHWAPTGAARNARPRLPRRRGGAPHLHAVCWRDAGVPRAHQPRPPHAGVPALPGIAWRLARRHLALQRGHVVRPGMQTARPPGTPAGRLQCSAAMRRSWHVRQAALCMAGSAVAPVTSAPPQQHNLSEPTSLACRYRANETGQYAADMAALAAGCTPPRRGWPLLIWRDTAAQHFDAPHGEFPLDGKRLMGKKFLGCKPVQV